jgi:hypothetical protein
VSRPRPVRRIFLGLTEVSGHYAQLTAGLRALGKDVTYVNLTGHPFGYGGDDPVRLARWARAVGRWRAGRGPAARLASGLVLLALRSLLLLWAAARFDAFVFGFNTSFLNLYDLPLLRLLGKRVLFQFHGSDSRPPYMDGSVVPPGTDWSPAAVRDRTRRLKRAVAWIDRWADVVIDNPTGGHFHEKPFVVWLRVGLPVRPADPAPGPAAADAVEFLHCPSHPVLKGSARIAAAVKAVAENGRPVRLRTLTGVPNAEVRRAIGECAGVVDQAYSDYAMPGLATEASWHARPVVIGGYAAAHWEKWLAEADRPPTLFVHPDRLEEAIAQLADDPAAREAAGRRAYEFVSTRWRPECVAARVVRLLEEGPPAAWLFDPEDTDYLHGCGLPEAAAAAAGRRLVEAYGPAALQVGDKPALQQALVAFYHREEARTA